MPHIKDIETAHEFILKSGLCTLFKKQDAETPCFWDEVDIPDDPSLGETKWGPKVEHVWLWKTELPTLYPDDVFYGKIKGGHACLMSIDFLRNQHYPIHHKSIDACTPLAREVFELIRLDPSTTSILRRESIERFHCSKSQFDTALKQLQVTLNIARLNEPNLKNDTWITFSELYPEISDGI